MAAVSLFWDTNMARRTSTGSEAFWLLVELNASKFVLLSSFPLIETICPKIRTKPPPKSAETPLPVSYSISHGGGDGLQVFSTVTELLQHSSYSSRPFSHDVTFAMLVSQTNPVGFKPFS